MASKDYHTDASQFFGEDPIGKPMGSRDDDWVTVEGVRYVPEAPLKAEIKRLRASLEEYSCPGIGACPVPRMKDGTCQAEASGGLCGQTAHEALAKEGK